MSVVTLRPAATNPLKDPLNPIEDDLRPLLLLALAGDNLAYARFLGRSAAHLRAFFRRRLAAFPDDVEDLVQETLLALHNYRHTWRPTERLTPWLYAIARYKLVDLLRSHAPRRAREIAIDDVLEDGALQASDSDAATARRDLARLLETLPERMRMAIVHVKIEGLSVAEAAARTGMSVSAVKVGIHRGLKKLAANLKDTP